MSEYDRVDEGEVTATWERTHKNDERTRVAAVNVAGAYLVLAVDVGRNGREVLAEELVATTLTTEEAEERAKSWIDENPKGIQGDSVLGGLLGG